MDRMRTGGSHRRAALIAAFALMAVGSGTAWAVSNSDQGVDVQHRLAAQSNRVFGFGQPLDHAATGSTTAAGTGAVEAAKGLAVSLVTDRVGQNADMIALWPNDTNPTWAIVCNEVDGRRTSAATLQRVRLSDGVVQDIVSGNVSCDPAHRTAWGTIVFGEEAGPSGRLFELLDPLGTSGVTVDRAAGTTSDPAHVAVRTALGQLSFEGVVVLPDGITYYADELRPSNGKPGGGLYKFVPSRPWAGGAPITRLSQSPLVAGSVHVLRLGLRSGGSDYGQGSNTGAGRWIPLTAPADLTTFDLAATALTAGGYTGYYRPEDMDLDPLAWADGRVRACWNNTGNDSQANWGETLCFEDAPTALAGFATGSRPVVSTFVVGDPELRMPDNLDFQPGTGILYVLMDAATSTEAQGFTNDAVFACLPDGADRDTLSDGCVRVLNSLDGDAEWTGLQFLADGRSFLINHQHRTQDGRAVPGTTDMLRVSGLTVKH